MAHTHVCAWMCSCKCVCIHVHVCAFVPLCICVKGRLMFKISFENLEKRSISGSSQDRWHYWQFHDAIRSFHRETLVAKGFTMCLSQILSTLKETTTNCICYFTCKYHIYLAFYTSRLSLMGIPTICISRFNLGWSLLPLFTILGFDVHFKVLKFLILLAEFLETISNNPITMATYIIIITMISLLKSLLFIFAFIFVISYRSKLKSSDKFSHYSNTLTRCRDYRWSLSARLYLNLYSSLFLQTLAMLRSGQFHTEFLFELLIHSRFYSVVETIPNVAVMMRTVQIFMSYSFLSSRVRFCFTLWSASTSPSRIRQIMFFVFFTQLSDLTVSLGCNDQFE